MEHQLIPVLMSLLVSFPAYSVPVRTATENFVTNKIANAVNAAKSYTDAQIALIPSPDFSPSNATLVATIEAVAPDPDFSAENAALVATIEEVAPVPGDYATVSNKAMTALQSYTETDPTIYSWAKASSKPTYYWSEILQRPATWDWSAISSKPTTLSGYGITDAISRTANTMTSAGVYTEYLINPSLQGGVRIRYSSTSDANQTTYMYSGVAARRNGATTDYLWDTSSESGIVRRSELSSLASSSDVSTLSNSVASIGAMLNAENARFVSTNYNSSTHIPSAYVQAKIDGSWLEIWNELTRWNWLTDTYLPANFYTKGQINSALDDKADRAWGFYDSHTGLYAPEDYTWISSPKIAIAGGLAYSRTVTAEGAVWVLESNGMVTETGGVVSNGFFRVSDDDGNALFEIVKGDKRTVGATANSVQTIAGFTPTKLQIGYAVQSESHPTLQIASTLSNPTWYAEDNASCPANVSWSGSSGNYTVTVQAKSSSATQLFVKAEYQAGGETYIKNVGPVSVQGGIYCTDGIHKVRPVYNNGNITWEVMQ